MSRTETEELIRRFFAALGAGDHEAVLACLSDGVIHDPGMAPREIGREKFRWFLAEHSRRFDEKAGDIVVMSDEAGGRAAAEYTLRGAYRETAPGLPQATGQPYSIPAGAFFEIDGGRISRVTTRIDNPAFVAALARG